MTTSMAPRPRSQAAMPRAAPRSRTEMEFISTSSRQANREAIQEIQAELNQKKTPAVRLVSEIIQKAMYKQASDIHIEPQATLHRRADPRGWRVARTWTASLEASRTRSCPASRFCPTWISESAAPRRMAASWWRLASAGWTCACQRCRRNTERKLSCGCSRPRLRY